MRFFEKLNNPLTVALILVIVVAANGFLFYRYATNLASVSTHSAPAGRATAPADTTTPGNADPDTGTTAARETTAASGSSESTAASDPPERPTLKEALQKCEGTGEECAREFVARVAPEAEYAGGRIDIGDSGQSRNVLYFVDPTMEPCKYEKMEGRAGDADTSYAVLIAEEGSFDGGAGCLPEL